MSKQAVLIFMEDNDTVGIIVGPFKDEAAAEDFKIDNKAAVNRKCDFAYTIELTPPSEIQ